MSQTSPAADDRSPDDASIDDLRQHHGRLEQRLEKLDDQRSLSPEEEFEIQVLKKRKLALKDRIRAQTND